MQESTSREKVLKAIRAALVNPMDPPFVDENYAGNIYSHSQSEYDEVIFAEALAKVGGQFVFNADVEEFTVNFRKFAEGKGTTNLHCYDSRIQRILNDGGIFCFNARDEFKDCQMGITSCEFLIARLGSIMVSSKLESGRRSFFWPPVHIVLAWKDQLVYDLNHAFGALKVKYKDSGMPSMITVITGPSRTADIEKTLVMGAHGPEKLIVFFIDQPYPVDVTMG
jgi:L-lactate dehydrogenase complex protein LldG